MLQHILIIISFSLFLDHFHLESLVFYHYPKIYFSSPFPSILFIFTYFHFLYLYPTNHYISGFYSYISGIFGFLDSIPLPFIFLEYYTFKYFWNSWNSSMLILDFKNFMNALQDYHTYIITHSNYYIIFLFLDHFHLVSLLFYHFQFSIFL